MWWGHNSVLNISTVLYGCGINRLCFEIDTIIPQLQRLCGLVGNIGLDCAVFYIPANTV